jgi:glycosyltransferase involved in cell wall biosynthesis
MNPKLSIIIPFFNVEKYIAECLESVYNQDIPEEEYEVICVNDCSPDHSRDIVLQYQQKHPNLILIEHEENKMLGAARNTGLRAARGEYVWFIDSDDYIEKNILGKLLSKLLRISLIFYFLIMQRLII